MLASEHPCREFRPLEFGNPYDQYFRDICTLNEYAVNRDEISNDDNVRFAFDEFRGLVSVLNRKPNVCFLGRFDSGKSTLANTLMRTNALPARIAPHTAIPTIVRHVLDRPPEMKDEVYLLNGYLQISDWNNQAKIEKHLIASGSFDLLAKNTHKSDRSRHSKSLLALAFLDSPFLAACNVMDFPGYGHDKYDDEKAQQFELLADAIFYLSPIIGFLDAQDILRIGMIMDRLPDYEGQFPQYPLLGNLFVIATHADPENHDIKSVHTVFDSGASRLWRELGQFALKRKAARIGKNISEDDMKKRLHVFWKRKKEMCASFSDESKTFLSVSLPAVWRTRADIEIDKFKKKTLQTISGKIDAYQKRLGDLDQLETLYRQYRDAEPRRKHELRIKIQRMTNLMRKYAVESKEEFRVEFFKLTTEEKIEELIRQRYDEKQDAEKYALGHIYELIKDVLSSTLEPKTAYIMSETESFVREYRNQQELDGTTVLIDLGADDMATFLAGAAGVGGLGALASLGLVYGGAWLAAETTGMLAAIGTGAVNIGAAITAGLSSVLSVLTGPIGIALVAGLLLFAMFRGPWERRLAKTVRKKINEEKILDKLLNGIEQYWKDTEMAFLAGIEEMEKQRENSMDELRAQLDDPVKGEEKMRRILEVLNNANRFFSDVSWNPSTQSQRIGG
uniref:Dynamin family protein n=1 Tax=Candidatus Kentrum sp. MB TaxID=2138164 RepID=A0A450XIK0_9GAMM|nr:MAG: Dynamin family protein [Candidatus Kentron sp. MB]VFK29563.1 MAG: Dynamin family protein [Candidatus Kentron sp. MB]VFK74833.1 MAG: Dynamin family protein [Candidatus Kentron sp. MB]